MTGKMTNTIRFSYNTLGLPYMSILIHLKPCLDAKWELHLNKQLREKAHLKKNGKKKDLFIFQALNTMGIILQQMHFVCQE